MCTGCVCVSHLYMCGAYMCKAFVYVSVSMCWIFVYVACAYIIICL